MLTYFKGSQDVEITWTSKNGSQDEANSNYVDIEFSKNNGETYISTIVTNTPDDGAYTWTLPSEGINATSVVFRVKATDKAGNTYNPNLNRYAFHQKYNRDAQPILRVQA